MIDPASEETFPLAEAGQKAGINKHTSTLHRWRHPGVRGVRLETVRIGGVHHTSLASLRRFFSRLTDNREQGHRLPDGDADHQARVIRELEGRFKL